jgi:hypothetical protein
MNEGGYFKSYLNLTWKIGFAALLCGLVGWGIYLGDQHRSAVLGFERDYLGIKPSTLEAESLVPPVMPLPNNQIAQASPPASPPQTVVLPSASPLPAQDWKPAQLPQQNALPETKNFATAFEAVSTPPSAVVPRDPMGSLTVPIAIRAKVLVDDRFANANPDWISYVQRTMSAAAQTFRLNFGIDLLLVGVGRWPDTLDGLDVDALYARLRHSRREGADILLGFVADRLGAYGYSKGRSTEDSPFNSAYGLVGMTPGSDPIHLRGVLRSIGYLLGATDVADPNSESYRLGSWMSESPVMTGRTFWIDLDNRSRILASKSKPFIPEAKDDGQR